MLLAVDTSTRSVGIALYDGTSVLGEMSWYSHNYHTVELAPSVQALFNRCGIQPGQLTVLAAALGPGSFTGLRIGLALVKGMAQGQNLPVIGIPTLDFLAAAQPPSDLPLAAVLQAGRGRLALGWYHYKNEHWQQQEGLSITTAEELAASITKPTLVCGELDAEEQKTLTRKYRNVILASPAHSARRPSFLAELAWERWTKKEIDDPASLVPIYVHVGEEIEA